jgi:hypothetical protein
MVKKWQSKKQAVLLTGFLLGLFFDPEGGSNMLL